MATQGWENVTESDIASRRRPRGRPERALDSTNGVKTTPNQLKPSRGHKYRAEPCLVSADLTLYTKQDIDNIGVAAGGFNDRLPLKARAEVHGISGDWFGSKKEALRWIELRQLEAAGMVRNLRRQVAYECSINGVRLGEWRADFTYREKEPADNSTGSEAWRDYVEDSKGKVLPLDAWKRAHVEAQYQIKIRIT